MIMDVMRGGVMVARRTHNPETPGSIPGPATEVVV